MNRLKLLSVFLTVFYLFLSPQPAQALITDIDAITRMITDEPLPDWTLVDFSQFEGEFVETNGPLNVGDSAGEDIVWNAYPSIKTGSSGASTPTTSWVGNGYYDLGENGYWDEQRDGYIVLNGDAGGMYFLFQDPVNGLGAFLNGLGGGAAYGEVQINFLLTGNQAVSVAVDILPDEDAVNAGFFLALHRDVTDIKGFSVSGHFPVVDDLKFTRLGFGTSAVPEPATAVLFSLGLFGVFFRQRR